MLTFHDDGTITGAMEDFPVWMVVQGFSRAVHRLADKDIHVVKLADSMEEYSKHLKETQGNI